MNVGLIGLGYRGLMLFRAIREARNLGFHIAAIASPEFSRTKRRSEYLTGPMGDRLRVPSGDELSGISISVTSEELLRDEGVKLVIITSHDSSCGNVIRQAIDAGKHVLVECPFATNADEARGLIEHVQRKRTRNRPQLMVAQYPLFHAPIYELVSKGLRRQQPQFGAVKSMRVNRIVRVSASASKNPHFHSWLDQARIADMSLLHMALNERAQLLANRAPFESYDVVRSLILAGRNANQMLSREYAYSPGAPFAEYLKVDADFERAVFTLETSRPRAPGDYVKTSQPALLHSHNPRLNITWTWEDWAKDPYVLMLRTVRTSLKAGSSVPEALSPALATSAMRACELELGCATGKAPQLFGWEPRVRQWRLPLGSKSLTSPLRLTYNNA